MLTDAAAYYLAYDALTHPGPASATRFQAALAGYNYCSSFANQTALSAQSEASSIKGDYIAAIGIFTPFGPQARAYQEPPLMVSVISRCGPAFRIPDVSDPRSMFASKDKPLFVVPERIKTSIPDLARTIAFAVPLRPLQCALPPLVVLFAVCPGWHVRFPPYAPAVGISVL